MINKKIYRNFLKFAIKYVPVLFFLGLIFYLSSIPGLKLSDAKPIDFVFRKLAHISVYALLYVSALWSVVAYPNNFTLSEIITSFDNVSSVNKMITATFCLMYGVSDEIHQHFIVSRSGKVYDILFDLVGILVAYTLLEHINKNLQTRKT